ncbi:MAG: hypothetical protein JXL84_09215, partial [Deltaproteobacteria bacterium]|nr:hypothetical protein [Deltaproteobacteria bacterium]
MDKEQRAQTQQEVTIDVFQPADAKGVGDLFRRVYGEGYPVKYYYDPDQLNESVATHETAPIVARSPRDGIVGTVSGFRSAPNPGLFEIGAGLVLPEYRGQGLNNRLITYIMENEDLHVRFGMVVIWGESVCNHTYMQKTTAHQKVVEMAIEVDLMAAEAYTKEQSAAGRVASIAAFRTYRPFPHTLLLPPCYQDLLCALYEDFDDRRTFRIAGETPAEKGIRTVLTEQSFEFASLVRVGFYSLGGDFEGVLSDLETRCRDRNIDLVQIWLKLTDPAVGWAVQVLRGKGYFICGALPRWFEQGDGLLMEKTFS